MTSALMNLGICGGVANRGEEEESVGGGARQAHGKQIYQGRRYRKACDIYNRCVYRVRHKGIVIRV